MTKTAKNYPTHKMYRIVKGRTEQDKDLWTEIAGLWAHKDNAGFSVSFKPNEAYVPGAQYVIRRNKSATPVAQPV